ncbi:histidine phosphatase family protein [Enterococcus sp. LJL98]
MKHIYFVRHSIRDTSITHEEAPLTMEGQGFAQNLSGYFIDKEIQHIFSSPFQRTMETIRPTATILGLPIIEKQALRERKTGTWLETGFSVFAKRQWADFDYKMEQGESLREVSERILPAFKEILTNSAGHSIICGHGTAFSVLFHELTQQRFGYEQFLKLQMPDVYVASFDVNHRLIDFKHEKWHEANGFA